ncbi:hypothetical protein [Mesorhizobium sp. M0118]|uniref:hypothetical protein n=1 Tax=Mesorhizobium sp. M0118 TaxID=2956884 RepID=UPI0033355DD5
MILTWLALASTVIFHATNIFAAGLHTTRPEWLAESQSIVEANQQDGPNILLRLDVADVIEGRLKATRNEVRSLLREARIGYTGLASSGRTVQVHITDPAQLDLAKAALKTVTDPVAESGVQEMTLDDSEPGLLKFTVTDAGLKYRTSAALAQSVEVIKDRIRDLGATHPVVRSTNEDGILVRTSGVADPQRLGQILTRPGHLSFQLVDLSMPVDEAISARPPVGSAVFYSMDDPPVPYLIEIGLSFQVKMCWMRKQPAIWRPMSLSSHSGLIPGVRRVSNGLRRSISASRLHTIRLFRRLLSESPLKAAPVRYREISPLKAPMTSPCCCAPAPCQQD